MTRDPRAPAARPGDRPAPRGAGIDVSGTEVASDSDGGGRGEGVGRRTFMARMIGAIAAIVALGWAIPLAVYGIRPTLRRRSPEWVDAGLLGQLAVNQPRELDVVVSRRDGWRQVTAVKSFWAYRTPDGGVVAFSPICPHLGCAYNWRDAEGRFVCPCHMSVFARDGAVLGGPAPRPLDRFDVKVEDGRLLVLPQEFKVGVPTKIPV